ncbi:MAG: hypothetical protein KatS3mg131_0748 [Candidatus Tectimicrobiota bacterium]|nr:MAG: hypothetical protein KatS3mg131_0748 [Candidatus Tectomicrobia bacterium]
MRCHEVMRYVRGGVRDMEGYVPGKQPSDGPYIKLNTNENPYPPSPRVLAALREAINADLRLYPDPLATPLREVAARLYGCDVDEVIVGNGSDDILTIIFRTFVEAGEVVATPAPQLQPIPRPECLAGSPLRGSAHGTRVHAAGRA